MEKNFYLLPNTVLEPLVDHWYAWAHLISPATAAKNIKNRHLSIMESYIIAPMAHSAAAKDPKLLGGPYIDLNGERVVEVKQLLENTKTNQRDLIDFATAFEELDKILVKEAKGYSLEPLYKKIPEILKGYVELVYDLNNHASIRIKESLLYKSKFYKEEMQCISLFQLSSDSRPFVFSTPRLKEENKLMLNIPFRESALDELYRAQFSPVCIEQMTELLNIPASEETLFRSFFTEEKPKPYDKYNGDSIRIRYFGHACILIETKDISILVDPVLSYTYETDISRYTYDDLPPEIDYVVITHNHQDHILLETLLRLRFKIKNIVVPRNGGGGLQDPNLKLLLKNIGFKNIVELDELEEIGIPDGFMIGIPFFGEHGDLDIQTKLGYFISIHGFRIMCLADSNNIEPEFYSHLQKQFDECDVLFLGMECDGAPVSWVYGPYYSKPLDRQMDMTRRFSGSNYERGIDIVNKFKFKEVYVYAMGMEPWVEFLTSVKYTDASNPIIQSNKLIEVCKSRGIIAERLYGEKEILRSGVSV